jgi:hypothetical protein
MSVPFAVVMLIGPGDKEIERARDVVESVIAYEPENFTLLLVDDVPAGRPLVEQISPQIQDRCIYLKNPRNGKGSGWGSGAAAGVLAALKQVSEIQSYEFVLKIDTDSLVIGEFADKTAARFQKMPNIGILGAYQYSPARMKDRSSSPALEKLLRQVTIWRRTPLGPPALQVALFGKYGRIRDIIRKAILNGYRLGEHCSGGGAAVSASCVRAMRSAGVFEDPTMWLRTPLGEDTVVALCAASVEYGIQSYEGKGDPFACKHIGLPDAPERLAEAGYSIIHSVKDHGKQSEEAVRAYFRQRRLNLAGEVREPSPTHQPAVRP